VLFCKGRTLGKLRHYQEAINDFNAAYDAFNANGEVGIANVVANTLRNKGFAHAMLDQREAAYESLNKAIELAPNFDLLYNTKGYIDNMFRNYEAAIESFTEAKK
jgi:tetratricopeptide (TPR) repeat protein